MYMLRLRLRLRQILPKSSTQEKSGSTHLSVFPYWPVFYKGGAAMLCIADRWE